MHAPQVPESARIRFRCKARTRWSDEDNQNVLNNAVYMTLLEEGRHAYFERLGLLELNHFPFVLAQTNIRFVAPGRGGAEVEIEVVTTRLGNSSFEQSYRVREARGGRTWCEAEAVLVIYDARTGRSSPMSTAFKQAVAEFEGLG
ncbi:MAG: acyl-CoA thioesterase [Planctomycetaceae bacterium]|jgi:acyl-CoA thioesterase FadM|nr:acyl-CoA thioesterase [Planctomycetaceae bacterium]